MAIPESVESQWYQALFEENCIAIMELLHAYPNLLKVGWESDPERRMKGRVRRERFGGSEKIRSTWKGRTALHVAARRGCARLVMQVLSLCRLSQSFSHLERAYRKTLRLDDEFSFSKIHYGHHCNSCNVCPIVGIRWLSSENSDYNLCPACYKNTKQNKKQFVKVEYVVGAQQFVYPGPASSIDASPEDASCDESVDTSEEEASDEDSPYIDISQEEASDDDSTYIDISQEEASGEDTWSVTRIMSIGDATAATSAQLVNDWCIDLAVSASQEEAGEDESTGKRASATTVGLPAAAQSEKVKVKGHEHKLTEGQSEIVETENKAPFRGDSSQCKATSQAAKKHLTSLVDGETEREYQNVVDLDVKDLLFAKDEECGLNAVAIAALHGNKVIMKMIEYGNNCKESARLHVGQSSRYSREVFELATANEDEKKRLRQATIQVFGEHYFGQFKEYYKHRAFNFLPPEEYLFHYMFAVKGLTWILPLHNLWEAVRSCEGEVWRFLLQLEDGQGRPPFHVAMQEFHASHFLRTVDPLNWYVTESDGSLIGNSDNEVIDAIPSSKEGSPNNGHCFPSVRRQGKVEGIASKKRTEPKSTSTEQRTSIILKRRQAAMTFRETLMELEIVRNVWRAALLQYGHAEGPNNGKFEDHLLTTTASEAGGIAKRDRMEVVVARVKAELKSKCNVTFDKPDSSTTPRTSTMPTVVSRERWIQHLAIAKEATTSRTAIVSRERSIQHLAIAKEVAAANARDKWMTACLEGASKVKRKNIIAWESKKKINASAVQKRMEGARIQQRNAFLQDGVAKLANIRHLVPSNSAWPAGPNKFNPELSSGEALLALTAPDAVGRTPVHHAAAMGLHDALKCLLQYAEEYPEVADTVSVAWNASPEEKDIYRASRNEYPDWEFAMYTDYLLKAQLPCTPLQAAMIHGNFDCAELLIKERGLRERDMEYRFVDEELVRDIVGANKIPLAKHKTAWGQQYTAWIGFDMLELACLVGAPIEFVAMLLDILKIQGPFLKREPLDVLKAPRGEESEDRKEKKEESEDRKEKKEESEDRKEKSQVPVPHFGGESISGDDNHSHVSSNIIDRNEYRMEKRKNKMGTESENNMRKQGVVLEHLWHPLHLAASTGRYDLVEYFLEDCHFNPFVEDFEGNSALHHAMKVRDISIKTHLYDYVSCEHINLSKQNVLRMAMKQILEANRIAERQGCINRFLQAGCDVFKINKKNQLPYPRKSLKNVKFLSWWYGKQQEEFKTSQGNLKFATNGIAVIAALVATASYVGPLQPPMGYDANQIQYENVWVSIFIVCDTISFYLAIVAIMLSLIPALPMPEQGMLEELQRTRTMVITAVGVLLPAILFVLIAFASSSISVMSANVTSEVGGIFTLVTTFVGVLLCVVVFILFFVRLLAFVIPRNPAIRSMYNASNHFTK